MSPSLVDRSISVHSPPRLFASQRNLVVASAEPGNNRALVADYVTAPQILWPERPTICQGPTIL